MVFRQCVRDAWGCADRNGIFQTGLAGGSSGGYFCNRPGSLVSWIVLTSREKEKMSPYYYLIIIMAIAAAFIYWRWGREARREQEKK